MYLDERKERARKMREEEARIGPRMPDRRFESTDWDNTDYQPLLILETIDGTEMHIYGPYTNSADLMHAYARLTYFDPFDDDSDGYDDGYTYELRPLEGRP